MLPGNHDPALPDSVYSKGKYDQILAILGMTHDMAVIFAEFDVEVGHMRQRLLSTWLLCAVLGRARPAGRVAMVRAL